MRTLIVGSDRDYCSVVKEFLELRGFITTVVLSYKEGIDKLFYEKPDLTVLELTSQELSPTLINKINSSSYFEVVDVKKGAKIKEGAKHVIILKETDQKGVLFDFLKSHLAGLKGEESEPLSEGAEEEGELELTSYPTLLAGLYRDKRTGVLDITSTVRLRIYLVNGVPVFAEEGDVGTALGRMLVESGRISEADYEKAIDTATEKKQRLGEVLVGMGLISPHELNSLLELQVREKIIRGFSCKRGAYSFRAESDFTGSMVIYQINLPQVLHEGIKRFVEVARIEEIFFRKEENPTVELTSNLKGQINSIGIGPKELRFIQLLKDRDGINDIVKTSRLPKDETLKLLYFLYLLGLLKVSGVPFPEVKKSPYKRPAKRKEAVGGINTGREEIKAHTEDLIVLEEEVPEVELEPSKEEIGESIKAEETRGFIGQELQTDVDKKSRKEIETELEGSREETYYKIIKEESTVGLTDQQAQIDIDNKSRKETEVELESLQKETDKAIPVEVKDSFTGKSQVDQVDKEREEEVKVELEPLQKKADEGIKAEETNDPVRQQIEEEKRRKKEALVDEILRLHSILNEKNYYEILGVTKGVKKEEIKDSYFNLVKKFHPDANPELKKDVREKTEEIFTKITEAYENLSDDKKRKEYDSQDEIEEVKSKVKLLYDAELAYKSGETLIKQRRYGEAKEKFREAVNSNPEEAAYVGALAWAIFLAETDKDRVSNEVRKQIEKAIGMNPKVAENYYYLGYIHKHGEDIPKAEANFLKAVEQNPDLIEAKRELRLLQQRKSEGSIKDKKREKKFWSSLFKK